MQINFADSTIVFMHGKEIKDYNEANPKDEIIRPCEGKMTQTMTNRFCNTSLGYPVLMEDRRRIQDKFNHPQLLLYYELINLLLEGEASDNGICFNLTTLHFCNTNGKLLIGQYIVTHGTAIPPLITLSDIAARYVVDQEGGLPAFLHSHCGGRYQE